MDTGRSYLHLEELMLLLNILEQRFKIVQVRSGLQLIVQVILNSRLYIETACASDGSHI